MNAAVTFGFMDETVERPWMGLQRVTEVFARWPAASNKLQYSHGVRSIAKYQTCLMSPTKKILKTCYPTSSLMPCHRKQKGRSQLA